LTGWLKGRNQRTNEEGLFPAGEFVTLIHLRRPKPVPKPRQRSQLSATSGYVPKSEVNDSGYGGSPRGMMFNCIHI